MRVLKKIFLYTLLLVIVSVGALVIAGKIHQKNQSIATFEKPCRMPLKYSIGEIDPRFNVAQDQLKDLISQAGAVWDKASGLNLFEYDPNAPLRIKMIYDERQQETDEASQLDADLKNLESNRSALDKQYGGLDKKYDQKLAAFKTGLASYEKRLKDYNEEVAYWNKKGGAPADEYAKLKKEQKDLNDEYDALKDQESELKSLASQINGIANKENSIVNNYNSAVTTYQNKYGKTQEFEKGVYDPTQGITIYQFREIADLRLTLVHELGHALGLGHTQNPQSIMYYLMGEQNLENPAPTAEDTAELKTVCQLN